MAQKTFPALSYPVTIRRLGDHLLFSVRDFNITVVEEWPEGTPYTQQIKAGLLRSIEKCWIKTSEAIKERRKSGRALPSPSKMALATEKELKPGRQAKPLTVKEVASILNISENSVRRIPVGKLRFRKTKGGHRRYTVGAVLAYKELFKWDEEKFGPISPTPKSLKTFPLDL